jgi:peptide deformylase
MKVVKIPDTILCKKTKVVSLEDVKRGKYKKLIDKMRQTMVSEKGIGLASNQVNKDLSLFVIDKTLAEESGVPDALFNPVITSYSKDTDELEEGCLSISEYYVPVLRAKKIMIKALDEDGNKIKFRARGFLARVLQHEADHLNGKTIKDRVKERK